MILVGWYDSPFVRRVAVTLHYYGLAFERETLSVFADFAAVRRLNPLGKVPALRLDDGTLLFDSTFILDYLDDRVGPDRALVPAHGAARCEVLRRVAIGLGLAEKATEYRTEALRRAPNRVDPPRLERVAIQIRGALDWLEEAAGDGWLWGEAMTQADVTAAVAFTNLTQKMAEFAPPGRYPKLAALTGRCEALDCFRAAPFGEG